MQDTSVSSLCVPAEPRFARTVRMTAINLAHLVGMSVEDVEDIRMLAEEAFVLTCATEPSEVKIIFTLGDSSLQMDFELGSKSINDDDLAENFAYADLILRAVCDEYAQDENSLHLVKEVH